MKEVYFTRHGQTVWNVENKICGATDIELTELGHQQAVALGNRIQEEGLIIDEVTKIPMRMEPRLKEQNFGRYESTPRNGAEFAEMKTHFIDHFGGGETMLHLAQRIYNLLDDIKADDKTCLLVAHNGIARIIHSYFYDMGNEEFAKFGIKNCEIRKYTYEE